MSVQDIIKKLSKSMVKKNLQQRSIQHLWIFGSRAKQTNTDQSDLDVLYQLDDTISQDGFAFFSAMGLLRETIGLPIDMVSIHAIHPDIRDEVLASKIAVW